MPHAMMTRSKKMMNLKKVSETGTLWFYRDHCLSGHALSPDRLKKRNSAAYKQWLKHDTAFWIDAQDAWIAFLWACRDNLAPTDPLLVLANQRSDAMLAYGLLHDHDDRRNLNKLTTAYKTWWVADLEAEKTFKRLTQQVREAVIHRK